MSVQMQALEALRGLIDALNIFTPAVIGALPAENGLCLTPVSGRTDAVLLDLSQTITFSVTLSCKHTDQATALDTLGLLFEALTHAPALPRGDGWQMVAIRADAFPGYLEREGAYWLYSGTLAVTCAAD